MKINRLLEIIISLLNHENVLDVLMFMLAMDAEKCSRN